MTQKIQTGDPHQINCPAFDCHKLVPLELIENVVSPSVARKFLAFDIKAFVESHPRIQWCPHPGCTTAVRLPPSDSLDAPPSYMRMFPRILPPPPCSRTVICPEAHSFCWQCLQEGHEPTCCQKWAEWHKKISEIRPDKRESIVIRSGCSAQHGRRFGKRGELPVAGDAQQAVPEVQVTHPEERGLQPHEVHQVPTGLLLGVSRPVEEARHGDGRLFPLQSLRRVAQDRGEERGGHRRGQGGVAQRAETQQIRALLLAVQEPLEQPRGEASIRHL